MSRTYRRKNCEWDFFDAKSSSTKKESANKKKLAKYHSDTYFTFAIPNWYINKFHTRPDRYQARSQIKKWIKNPDHEVIIDKWLKCAGYRYW